MTRQEYKEKATQKLGMYFVNEIGFPRLLQEMAIYFFMQNEFESEMAIETKRRLNELKTKGWTE